MYYKPFEFQTKKNALNAFLLIFGLPILTLSYFVKIANFVGYLSMDEHAFFCGLAGDFFFCKSML